MLENVVYLILYRGGVLFTVYIVSTFDINE